MWLLIFFIQKLYVIFHTNYKILYGIFYIRTQFFILNVFVLIVHKTQSLIMIDIFISFDNNMFVSNHVYTTLNRIQRWNQMFIFVVCKEIFKVNEKTISKYKRLENIVKKMFKEQFFEFVWRLNEIAIFIFNESLSVFSTFHWFRYCLIVSFQILLHH